MSTDQQGVFRDHGQILAAGALVHDTASSVAKLEDVEWVRNVVLFVKCDKAFDVQLVRYDREGTASTPVIVAAAQPATGGLWVPIVLTGANALLGFAAGFALKNVDGALATTVASLRVQLFR